MEIYRTAHKHGINETAILHPLDNALTVLDLEPAADPPKVLAIGPDYAGSLPEIVWLEVVDGDELVIKAMALRLTFYDLLPFPGEGNTMTERYIHRTDSGRTLSDDELDRLAVEADATDDDVEALKTRRRGLPPMGSGPAHVVAVRIDPELPQRSRLELKRTTPRPARSFAKLSAASFT